MAHAAIDLQPTPVSGAGVRIAAIAWLVAAVYYFYQYALRSAPAVMMPQLSEAFGLTAMGVASILGLFYYAYAPFSLVAGAALDRLGPPPRCSVGRPGNMVRFAGARSPREDPHGVAITLKSRLQHAAEQAGATGDDDVADQRVTRTK